MASLEESLASRPPAGAAAPPEPALTTDLGPRLRRWLVIATVALAFLIHIPGLRTPFFLDDYTQRAMVDGRYPSRPGPLQLYDFIDDGNRALLLDRGILPWWSHPQMVMRFWRPLSSGLLWLDYRIAGDSPAWGHVHSFLWWLLACFAVHALFRRYFAPRVAFVGVAVYALAPCHALPVAWMANREEIISTALGTIALLLYLRWRDETRARDGLLAFAVFGLAALAGEYTLCFAGYVAADEIVRRRVSLPRRLLGLLPFVIPAVAYAVAHQAWHYGAFGIGYYHDPISNTLSYVGSGPRRLAVLLTTAWLGTSDALWLGEAGWKLGALTIIGLGLLVVPIMRTLRELEPTVRSRALALLLGSGLSMLPVMAVDPSVRLLEVPMIGVSAVVALLVEHAWFPSVPRPRRGAAELTELVVLGLAFIHFFRAPLDTFLSESATRGWAIVFDTRLHELAEKSEGKSKVTILRANVAQTTFFAPLIVGDGGGEPKTRTLTLRSGRCLVRRTSARSLELVGGPAGLFPIGPDDLLRDVPIHQGEHFDLDGMRVTLLELHDDGTPHRARFDFDRDLDDPSMLWVVDTGNGFREEKIPSIGHGELLEL
jgi:hypothetical protein